MKRILNSAFESIYINCSYRIIKVVCRMFFRTFSSSARKWGHILDNVDFVLHVGAQFGQERLMYDIFNLQVIWIEAIEDSYLKLVKNIGPYKKQSAINSLITESDNEKITFNIASNQGASSSILPLHLHKEAWNEIYFESQVVMESQSLSTILDRVGHIGERRLLVLDTQGSELMILSGAREILKNFDYILVECADFEAYKGGSTHDSIDSFMSQNEFKKIDSEVFARIENLGNYMNVLYSYEGEKTYQ